MKYCFLFGHRDAPDAILSQIEEYIEHVHNHRLVSEFVVGKYGNYDRLATIAISNVKKRHPEIRCILMTPYHIVSSKEPALSEYDEVLYPDGLEDVPLRYAIIKANQQMVKNTDCVICYVKHFGNTRDLLDFAKRQESAPYIINIADRIDLRS